MCPAPTLADAPDGHRVDTELQGCRSTTGSGSANGPHLIFGQFRAWVIFATQWPWIVRVLLRMTRVRCLANILQVFSAVVSAIPILVVHLARASGQERACHEDVNRERTNRAIPMQRQLGIAVAVKAWAQYASSLCALRRLVSSHSSLIGHTVPAFVAADVAPLFMHDGTLHSPAYYMGHGNATR